MIEICVDSNPRVIKHYYPRTYLSAECQSQNGSIPPLIANYGMQISRANKKNADIPVSNLSKTIMRLSPVGPFPVIIYIRIYRHKFFTAKCVSFGSRGLTLTEHA